MTKPTSRFYTGLFMVLACVEVAAIGFNQNILQQLVKPLLIPILLLLLMTSADVSKKRLLVTALVFSFAGDVLLIFEQLNPIFFICGLASFLITHICYIIYFGGNWKPAPSLLRKQPWIAALIAAYGISLIQLLYPVLGIMRVPVVIYAIVICLMMICSFHVFYKVNRFAAYLYTSGAILFAVSDSVLAINKFYHPFAAAGPLIMATYCLAQLCIIKGATYQQES